MAQSLVGSLLLSLRFWCAQSFSCPFQECFPSPLEILHQIPLVFKVKFPEGSQSLCWIPRLGNVLWALEHLQQCENFFDIIVLQFEGLLLGESMVRLINPPRGFMPHAVPPRSVAARALIPMEAPTGLWLCRKHSLKGRCGSVSCRVPGSWSTQGFVWVLWASLAGTGFDSKHNFACPTTLWGFSFALGCGYLFWVGSNFLLFKIASATSCNFGVPQEYVGQSQILFWVL